MDAEGAQPPPGRRPDRGPLAAIALSLPAVLSLAACSGGAANTSSSPANSPAPPTTPATGPQRLSETGSSLMAPLFYEYAIVTISQPSATRAQDLRAFLSWAISTGTAQLAQVNFQPLPPSVVTLSQAQIAKIRG